MSGPPEKIGMQEITELAAMPLDMDTVRKRLTAELETCGRMMHLLTAGMEDHLLMVQFDDQLTPGQRKEDSADARAMIRMGEYRLERLHVVERGLQEIEAQLDGRTMEGLSANALAAVSYIFDLAERQD
jgi:hypothetical protein